VTAAATSSRHVRNAVDAARPYAWLLEKERSESGETVSVATIFLTNRQCPWRCIYCDLWKNTLTETVPLGALPAQIDFALAQLGMNELREPFAGQESQIGATRPSATKQIKLYNAGSFFDPQAIPPEDVPAIAQRVRRFERVIVECHPALIGAPAVQFRDLLGENTKLEVALGLEIADDAILARLNKRMSLAMFARAAQFLCEHDIAVRAFIMVKPPFVRSEDEALRLARHSIDFAFNAGATAVSLIPARFGTEELAVLAARGDFAPPKFATLEAALDYGVGLGRGRVFADLWDLEKFADCPRCHPARHKRLSGMNLQQRVLPRAACTGCDPD
jgi:archaeosine synthase beta-subunit